MADLSYAIGELNDIINEIDNIRNELINFKGINAERCSLALYDEYSKYCTSRSRLYDIDTSKIDE